MMRLLMLLFFFVLSSGVRAECSTPEEDFKALRAILKTKPAESAKKALAKNDTRFWGVAGFTLEVPGADSLNCVVERSNVQPLPATSDYVCDDAHQKLIDQAGVYAKKYNVVIRNHLESKKSLKCEP